MYNSTPPKKLLLELKRIRNKRCLITFHSLGDLDACASAIVLSQILGKKAIVAMQDRVNSQCKKLIDEKTIDSIVKFADAKKKYPGAPVILLDCNEMGLLPSFKGESVRILIDHHAKTKDSVRGDIEWIDPQSSSVAQMISKFLKTADAKQANLLLLAILSDSANLENSTPQTFLQISHLLSKTDLDFSQIQNMLHTPKNVQSRMRILEGLRNISFSRKGGLVCAVAQVPSHESHVAEILVRSGADCAFAASAGKKNCAISARMRMEQIGHVPLAEIMEEVGLFIGGNGGGHPAAAGANGKYAHKVEDALNLCRNLFFEHATARIKLNNKNLL